MNNSQYGDNQSVSSHFQQNQTHSLSQRHLTQTQIRTTLASQTQQPSYLPSNQHSQLQSQQQSDDGSVLGAQIMNFSIEEIREGYKKFLLEFEGQRQVLDQTQMEEEQQESYEFTYREKMNNMKDSGDFFLMINADHLRQYNQDIYKRMINFPGDIIPILDSVSIDTYQELRKAMREQGLNQESDQEIFSDANKILVGIYNLRHSKRIRDISPKDINKLISIKGIVIRVSSIFPEMRQAAFQCLQYSLIRKS
ncbi:Nucleic acid-binding, OB-fold [Pseudocohnilembus persalinus]|uniref:Nucleic acid-binding, OB-fold n=1 Tax=Pseudocohnilembus persalinus TaxID=266149 RepID=A0A0V0QFR0_PSEPJ|nr:Nucleic acid-binding, OB-fold [Pseudocohnilembus persalinus]|eukprot:KRX01028.1 Nucleic acid-binding, OB-fold [Pseudocohnilembus persalinus]